MDFQEAYTSHFETTQSHKLAKRKLKLALKNYLKRPSHYTQDQLKWALELSHYTFELTLKSKRELKDTIQALSLRQSNCLIEAIKAWLQNPLHIHIKYMWPLHFYWRNSKVDKHYHFASHYVKGEPHPPWSNLWMWGRTERILPKWHRPLRTQGAMHPALKWVIKPPAQKPTS